MDNQQNSEVTRNNKIPVVILLGGIILFLTLGIVFVSRKVKQDKDTQEAVSSINKPMTANNTPTPTLIPYAKKGSMYLIASQRQVKEGQTFTFQVQATSDKSDIVGFDMVLGYDENMIEFKTAESTVPSFQSYTYPRKGYVSVTMIKSLQETEKTVFDKTTIATITFIAKKKGKTTIGLTAKGNDSTKFADNNANMTYPDTNTIDLEIQ